MADKTKSIKSATDRELDELLVRLRKESELQSLIRELKRKSTPIDQFNSEQNFSYSRPEISTEQPIESLYHYGILGMRWGVRRQRGPDGRVIRGTREKKTSQDHKQARQLRKDAPQGLSTQELQTLNRRLQLEKQYKDLDPNSYKKGATFVKGIIAGGTTVTALHALVTSDAAKAIVNVLKKPGKDILKGRV